MRLTNIFAVLLVIVVSAACSSEGAGDAQAAVATADASASTAETPAPAETHTLTAATDTIEVWKDPYCGCCKSWIEHMQKNGFAVIVHDTASLTPIKQRLHVGADLVSCHTGVVRGYAVEGHVPADLVRKMITEKPDIAGIAVPGMPIGSPGMEQGDVKQPYDVIAFGADGTRKVYAKR